MARRNLTTVLILSCCLTFLQAESGYGNDNGNSNGYSILKPKPLGPSPASIPLPRNADSKLRLTPNRYEARTLGVNTDASKAKRAVHINATGVDAGYRGRRSSRSEAANRLRAIRNGELLPAQTRKPASAKTGQPNMKSPSIEILSAPPSIASQTNTSASAGTGPSTSKPLLITNTIVEGKPLATDSLNGDGNRPSVTKQQVPSIQTNPHVTGLQPTLAEPTPAEPVALIASGSFTPLAPKLSMQGESHVPDKNNAITGDYAYDTPTVPFTDVNVEVQRKRNTSRLQMSSSDKTLHRDHNTTTPTHLPQVNDRSPQERLRLGSQLGMSTSDPAGTVGEKPKVTPPREDSAAETEGKAKENVLLSNRSPVLEVQTHGSPTIKVGRTATYYLTASNIGSLPAEDVEVTVNIPSWAEVTQNQASAGLVRLQPNQQGHSVMKWTISKLDAETRQNLRLDFVPRISRPIDLRVTWNFKSVSGLAQIQVQEPKLLMSVVGPPDIQYNDTKLYTITVSNPGSGDAENVVLTLLPISDGRGNAGVREMGTIKAGTRRAVEVELTARQAGELVVRATAAADGGLQTQAEQRVRVRRANLEIEAVGPTNKYAGTEARYAIKISNNGDATANDVVAAAALPMAAKYTNSSVGGTYDPARGKVRWSLRTLQPGAFQIVELTITLMGEGKNRLDIRTSAADQLTATGSVTTEVESLADLKLLVNDPKGAVAVGTEMIYEVRIINRGTKVATKVNVVGYFSEGIEPVAVIGWRADIEVGQVVFEQIPRIAPGQEMVVKVTAQASRPGDHVFRTELDSNDPVTKLAVEEWTRFYGDEIGPKLFDPGEQHATKPHTLPSEQLKQRR